MKPCLFCSITATTNTEMSLKLEDGTSATVTLCTSHAEQSTIKTIRTAFSERQAQIAAVLDQAKALGLTISMPVANDLSIAQQINPQPALAPSIPQPAQQVKTLLPDMIDTEVLDQRQRQVVSAAPSVPAIGLEQDATGYEQLASYKVGLTADKLPPEALKGKAKLVTVEGRAGQPLVIEGVRIDGTGVTNITVNKSMSSAEFTRRFQAMAELSRADNVQGQPNFREGYHLRRCPICQGNGTITQKNVPTICPKCQGSGHVNA